MITYIPDHADQAVGLMLSQFQTATRLRALVRALAGAVQFGEDITFGVLVGDNPVDGGGAVLDRWGRLVGEARGGLNDGEYRGFLQARIGANVGGSSVEELLRLWAIVTAPGEVRWYQHLAGITLLVWRDEPMRGVLAARVGEFFRAIGPAGVEVMLVEAAPRSAAYRFDEGPGLDVGALARVI